MHFMFFEAKIWTADQLAEQFASAGFAPGQNLILHSSLKSIGRAQKGPATIVDAILSTIGPAGNLLVPVFTYSLPGWKGEPFDINTSPARTGAIPEYIRKDERSIRSFHPTHSVSVIGPQAAALTHNHMDFTPLGIGCPFSRMLDRDATILMLGTHQDTNSSLHLCEVMAELPYINTCFSENTDFEIAWFHNSNGEIEFTPLREIPGCSRGFRAIEPHLIKHGVLRSIKIGNATCQVLRMKDLVQATIEILKEEPTILLCTLEHCAICPKRRALMKALS